MYRWTVSGIVWYNNKNKHKLYSIYLFTLVLYSKTGNYKPMTARKVTNAKVIINELLTCLTWRMTRHQDRRTFWLVNASDCWSAVGLVTSHSYLFLVYASATLEDVSMKSLCLSISLVSSGSLHYWRLLKFVHWEWNSESAYNSCDKEDLVDLQRLLLLDLLVLLPFI